MPGVVVGEVEPPVALHDARDQRLVVGRARDVAREVLGAAAVGLDLVDRLARAGGRARQVGDDHGGALAGETDRARAPDSARRAGDEPGLAFH